MHTVPFYDSWTFWIYAAAWLPFTLTMVNYGLRAPWWNNPIGRSLFLTLVAIVAVLTNVLVALIFPHYGEWRSATRVVFIGGVILAGWYQFSAILRVLREVRAEARALMGTTIQHEEQTL